MATLSTHVLDIARGLPAAGVPVQVLDDAGRVVDEGVTNADGRIPHLCDELTTGTFTVRFDVSAYQPHGFYPEVAVTFVVGDTSDYHVPLLLSPYGYSTYRGS